MAFGVEEFMPTEFLVPSLQIQVEHRLNEKHLDQAPAKGLLGLEEKWLSRTIEIMLCLGLNPGPCNTESRSLTITIAYHHMK